ncbi:MAG: chemotaxis protein CheB [Gemmatimonadaceae bacterium]
MRKEEEAERATVQLASADPSSLIMVGLGASAGGVEALIRFFRHMPADSGMSFVVVMHFSVEHESNLAQILAANSKMNVAAVTEPLPIVPNSIYVITPIAHVVVRDHRTVAPAERPVPERSPTAVDHLFRSLADTFGPRAACIVLSGSGSDGARGLTSVRERDGFALAQDPREAEFAEMPRKAIATGLVDRVLPVDEIPAALLEYNRSQGWLHRTGLVQNAESTPADPAALQSILDLVRRRTGHDLTNYKQQPLLRRLARRLQVHHVDDLPSYLTVVQERPDEAQLLLRNLLIHVTHFIRDVEAFQALEAEVLPALFAGRGEDEVVRVWSAACASGEEPYSLAMLLAEVAERQPSPPRIQIFASDVDHEAVTSGRSNRFPPSIESDVSSDRLQRFFRQGWPRLPVAQGGAGHGTLCPNDLLRDPPFSRLDLVVCRNVLIYFNRETQANVLRLFHSALNPGGFLFLGSSESADGLGALFQPVNKAWRLYRKGDDPGIVAPPRLPLAAHNEVDRQAASAQRAADRAPTLRDFHYQAVERLASPSLLVNSSLEVVHVGAAAGRFLHLGAGAPSPDLFRIVHPDLIPDLRASVFAAQRDGKPAELRNARMSVAGRVERVHLAVHPVLGPGGATNYLLVVFRPVEPLPAPDELDHNTLQGPDAVVGNLEAELRLTKDRLRLTVDQHDVTIADLKASNEELQAINEELRAASEEVEASKEELQSVNEELITVNQELKDIVDELSRANGDLQNLMASTDIGTIFLDRQLKINRYTPRVLDLFNIIPSDVGRPLHHLTSSLEYRELARDAADVLREPRPIEREVVSAGGSAYLLRIAPYRTPDGRVDGVVLSFIAITARRSAEQAGRWLSAVVRSSNDAVMSYSLDRQILSWNTGASRSFGYTEEAVGGRSLAMLAPPGHDAEQVDVEERVSRGESIENLETTRLHKSGTTVDVSLSVSPIADARGAIVGVTSIAKDITERRRQHLALQNSEIRLRHAIEIETVGVVFLSPDGEIREANDAFERLLDLPATPGGNGAPPVNLGTLMPAWAALRDEYRSTRRILPAEHRISRADGSMNWLLFAATRLSDAEGVAFLVDVSARKRAEESLLESARRKDEFLAILAHELRNPLAPIRNALQLLVRTANQGESTRSLMRIMDRQVRLMVRLVDDLRDVSRINRGWIELRVEHFDLRDAAADAMEAVASQFLDADVRLETSIGDEALVVHGDRSRLSQVVGNLLNNACRFSDSGNVVELHVGRRGSWAKIVIRDFDIGIPPDQLSRIFEMFTQLDTSLERTRSGLGVGLALVRQIVEMHHGEIEARSDGPGTGAEFVLRLPLATDAAT